MTAPDAGAVLIATQNLNAVLHIMQWGVIALIFLFFLRVIRAVWVELREPKNVQVSVPAPAPQAQFRPAPAPAAAPAYAAAPAPARSFWGGAKEAPGPPDRLVIISPGGTPADFGQTFELGDEITVGRAVGCGVSLPDDTFISSLHARIFRRDGAVFVEDLGSTNGTFINEVQLNGTAQLHRGDRLQVGRTVLELAPPTR